MITKLSDQEFERLKERVQKGKDHLDGKWNGRTVCPATGMREQTCVAQWFLLSELCVTQERMRTDFPIVRPHSEVMAGIDTTLDRIARQMHRKGYIRTLPKKPLQKGGTQKNDTQKSESYSLFESPEVSQGFSDQWAL